MRERTVKNWHNHCLLPDGTELQEHSIKTDRNIVIGEFCQIDYGLRGADVYVGESTKIREYVWASGDARIGNWCEIGSDIIAKEDAYIGEGVKINGKLSVLGALDIGENVEIRDGFEARGDIEVRNPMPVFMFIIVYLMTLLRIENEKELDRILDNLFSDDEEERMEIPLMIPARSKLNMKVFAVPSTMKIGKGCRLHGNIRAGSIDVQQNTVIFGSLRARNKISVVDGVTVHGNVESGSTVHVHKGAHILGDVIAKSIVLHEDAKVDGTIEAPHGLRIERGS
ncbi:polymer-forming cytoskeletal protein [uncultured Methanoregula sp.]|uniref:polymer-forming cytoskeletal protein n=1 Tax=uncultured Methanoregula sp. TaxID=1005933 RepID=UPI002AAAD0E0|nr:polymer-forming cytoskeletal protein [uncultured Methanoregula sp.]